MMSSNRQSSSPAADKPAPERGGGWHPTVSEVMANRRVGRWVKRAITSLLKRDCVEAANDAELVATVMANHCDEFFSEVTRSGALPLGRAARYAMTRARFMVATESAESLWRLTEARLDAREFGEDGPAAAVSRKAYRNDMLDLAALALVQAALADLDDAARSAMVRVFGIAVNGEWNRNP
jgi:hypothetical protein